MAPTPRSRHRLLAIAEFKFPRSNIRCFDNIASETTILKFRRPLRDAKDIGVVEVVRNDGGRRLPLAFLALLLARVTGRAQGLERAAPEPYRLAAMPLDVIADRRRDQPAHFPAHPA